ncbi:hypothetical protein HCA69_02350 [Listeria grandensis]|uniref:PBSX phage terminase small subunit-like N-terminal domain-containing protein n=1 Tax=Listeria grandensis TaxID=1494963 RepID=A0A7X0Y1B6_9LIST|nr:phage terminase small subunit-related protein [Listeria grandensis]MBC1935191.1 hypothetical protein [Listeria grandensis]
MAQKRNPLRDDAKRMWLESGGQLKLAEIAAKLEKPPSTIRKWKSQDRWDNDINESAPNDKGSAPLRSKAMLGNKNATGNKGGKGAPKGNDYAKGNAGGGAPVRNENALKTGEYQTIMWGYLSDDEIELFQSIPDDPIVQITATIKELEIRKYRMAGLLDKAKNELTPSQKKTLKQLREVPYIQDVQGKKVRVEREELVVVEEREETLRKLDDVLRIEDALTRVTNQLVKAIKQKSDLEQVEVRNSLIRSQTSLNKEKMIKPELTDKSPNFSKMSDEELRDYARLLRE